MQQTQDSNFGDVPVKLQKDRENTKKLAWKLDSDPAQSSQKDLFVEEKEDDESEEKEKDESEEKDEDEFEYKEEYGFEEKEKDEDGLVNSVVSFFDVDQCRVGIVKWRRHASDAQEQQICIECVSTWSVIQKATGE